MTIVSVTSDSKEQQALLFHLRDTAVTFSNDPTLIGMTKASPKTILRVDGTGIGGLSDHIDTINWELASMPFPRAHDDLRRPISFLLHGPEGCGKTLLMERLSKASWRKVYRVDDEWLIANRKEQAIALSEDVFDAALKHQPSLIMIDNLDKLVQKAETLVDRIQKELKKLPNTQVVVAAAARRIYDIDARLRSSQGLRIELEVFPPNVKQREDILRQILGRNVERSTIDLPILAEKCHGFVGRDIDNLCYYARERVDRQIFDSLGDEAKDTIIETLEGVDFVRQEDFDAVIGQIKPSVLQDSIIEVPKVKWHDIAGVDHVRSLLESIVVRPYKVSVEDIRKLLW